MSFSITARKRNFKYALFSVAFICFAGFWAASPFLGMFKSKTTIAAGTSPMFIGRGKVVDLRNIGVGDVQGRADGFASGESEQSGAGVSLDSTSALSNVIKDKKSETNAKEPQTKSASSGGRYTPSKQTAGKRKENKKDFTGGGTSDDGKIQPTGKGALGGTSQQSSTTASIRKQFFGTGNPDAKLTPKPAEKFEGKKTDSYKRLEFTAGHIKNAQKLNNPEEQKTGTQTAYRGNLAMKDIDTPLDGYIEKTKGRKDKIIEVKHTIMKDIAQTGAPSRSAIGFAPMPETVDMTEEEKKKEREYMEKQLRESEELQRKAKNEQTLLTLIGLILGPIIGLIV